MPVGIRATLASLSQIDRSLDEASLMLRASRAAQSMGRYPRRSLPLLLWWSTLLPSWFRKLSQ